MTQPVSSRPDNPIETQFTERGSLEPPQIVGRIVRLLFGAGLLWGAYPLVVDGLYPRLTSAQSWMSGSRPPQDWTFYAFVLLAFYVTPYVVNIGFTKNWRRRPQWVIAGGVVVFLGVDYAIYGTWWAGPLAVFVLLWLAYFAAHLGLSFVLSSVIATPGCEMRAIPHLWTLVTGRATKEHYCPGLFDRLDKWERPS